MLIVMSRIGPSNPSASAAIQRTAPPPAQGAEASFRGHQVKLGDCAVISERTKAADKQAYKHSIADKSVYMQTKQARLLTENPAGSITVDITHEKLASGVDKAYGDIKKQGNQLTEFKNFRTFRRHISGVASQIGPAKEAARAHPPRSSFASLSTAEQQTLKTGAELSKVAYKGIDGAAGTRSLPEGHQILTDAQLPKSLSMFYNDQTGIINTPQGAQALLAQEGDTVKVVFAGTDPGAKSSTGRIKTVRTDVVQRVGGFSPMYRDAAGIGRMILNQEGLKDKQVVFMGHSLGGGLAQFAAGANIEGNEERVSAMTYNTAGLSATTLGALGKERVAATHDVVQNVRLQGDPVSPGTDLGEKVKGMALGQMFTIEREGVKRRPEPNTHKMDSLLAELDKAMP